MRTLVFLLCSALALTSCTRTVYVPAQSVKTDSVAVERVRVDSIYIRDSIAVLDRGDTVRIDRWHTRYITRIDTAVIERAHIDSIAVPYRVEVEKPLTLWQRTKQALGGWALLACLGVIALAAYRRWRK